MRNLAATVESLRTIALAGERFLGLFAVDCLVEERRVCERLFGDIMNAPPAPATVAADVRRARPSSLYPGSNLDD